MEKVKVVKPIAGILETGDILISPFEGADFLLEEVNVTSKGSNERFVSLDYVTVSENVPQYFVFERDEDPIVSECYNCGSTEDCDCTWTVQDLINADIQIPGFVVRTPEEITARYNAFEQKFEEAYPGTEAQIVYKNLMWFIEWLEGKAEIL